MEWSIRGAATSRPGPRGALQFFRNFRVEAVAIDDDPLMRALGDLVDAVVRRDGESEPAAFNPVERYVNRDGESGRGCREVREIDEDPERLLLRPVEVRAQRFDAGPFHQPHPIAGGEYLRQDKSQR